MTRTAAAARGLPASPPYDLDANTIDGMAGDSARAPEAYARRAADDGLALIGVLVVVAILVVLAVIVLTTTRSSTSHPAPAVGNRSAAVVAACTSDLQSVRLSIDAVQIHEGSYPTDAAALSDPDKGGLLKQYPSSPDYRLTYPGASGPPHVDVSGPGLQSATDRCVP